MSSHGDATQKVTFTMTTTITAECFAQPVEGAYRNFLRPFEYPREYTYDKDLTPAYTSDELTPAQVLHVPGEPGFGPTPGYVYMCFDEDGAPLYIGCSTQDHPMYRWSAHVANAKKHYRSARFWVPLVHTVVLIPTGDASLLERMLIEDIYPWWNIQFNEVNLRRRRWDLTHRDLYWITRFLPPLVDGWTSRGDYDFPTELSQLEKIVTGTSLRTVEAAA